MQTRRDQLQAYRYSVRRILASMLGNDPDAPEQPMRRVGGSTLIGLMVGALICGGVAFFGWIGGGAKNNSWKTQTTVIHSKETGSQYLWAKSNSGPFTLYEVSNWTSMQLLAGAAQPNTISLSQRNLQGLRKGPEIGIPGAPQLLPGKDDLIGLPWSVCTRASSTKSGGQAYGTNIVVGSEIVGEEVGAKGIVVQAGSNGRKYLVWNGSTHAVDVDSRSLQALGLTRSAPVVVSPGWLRALPKGSDLAGPVVQSRGATAGYQIAGQAVALGQVFQNSTEASSYWLAYADRLHPITTVQAKLLLGMGEAKAVGGGSQVEPTKIPPAASNANGAIVKSDLPVDVPQVLAPPEPARTSACMVYDDPSGGAPKIRVVTAKLPAASPAAVAAVANADPAKRAGLADATIIPTGKASVVAMKPKIGSKPTAYYVLTDDGKLFPVPSGLLSLFGWDGYRAPQLPANVLKLVPFGPSLNTDDARKTVDGRRTAAAAPSTN